MNAVCLSFCLMLRMIRRDMMLLAALLGPVLAGALQGIVVALMIVAFAANKLEGMAAAKFSSLLMLGAAAPFFLPSPLNLCLSFLPSFWMGKAILEERMAQLLPCFATVAGWIAMLLRRAQRKE